MNPERADIQARGVPDPAQPILLEAGPLTAELHGADLRHVRLGDVELVERIYVAVRDQAWNTVPGEWLQHEIQTAAGDAFSAIVRLRNRAGELDWEWTARITGTAGGELRYDLSAVARADSVYANLGLNIHHPMAMHGQPFQALGPDGAMTGALPDHIEPQRFDDGHWAIFAPFRSLSIELPTARVELSIDGDMLEMQDQRNWTDANYKSYTTPLDIPRPLRAVSGAEVRQVLVVRGVPVAGRRPGRGGRAPSVGIALGSDMAVRVPPLGTTAPSHERSPTPGELDRLRELRLDHVRVDARPGDPGWRESLHRQLTFAAALAAPIQLALVTDGLREDDADAILTMLAGGPNVVRIGVFGATRSPSTGSTPPELMAAARSLVASAFPSAPVLAGSDHSFAEVNRLPPDPQACDGISFPICPTIHAGDDLSIVENLRAQAAVIRSAARLAAGKPVHVSPVTMRMRRGPYPEVPPDPVVPIRFDPRQATPLGAAWTLGSVKYAAEAGAASITYYEATGYGGLINDAPTAQRWTVDGAPAATVYPLYRVLHDISAVRGWRVRQCSSDDPLRVEALAVRHRDTTRLLFANLTPDDQSVVVDGVEEERRRLRLRGFECRSIDIKR